MRVVAQPILHAPNYRGFSAFHVDLNQIDLCHTRLLTVTIKPDRGDGGNAVIAEDRVRAANAGLYLITNVECDFTILVAHGLWRHNHLGVTIQLDVAAILVPNPLVGFEGMDLGKCGRKASHHE
jgi:hypothetical protein